MLNADKRVLAACAALAIGIFPASATAQMALEAPAPVADTGLAYPKSFLAVDQAEAGAVLMAVDVSGALFRRASLDGASPWIPIVYDFPLVDNLAVLPDGRLISGKDNGAIIVGGFNQQMSTNTEPVPGGQYVKDVDALPDGALVAVTADGALYISEGLGMPWFSLPGQPIQKIAVLPEGTLLGVGFDSSLKYREALQGDKWRDLRGTLKAADVAALKDGTILLIGLDGKLYRTTRSIDATLNIEAITAISPSTGTDAYTQVLFNIIGEVAESTVSFGAKYGVKAAWKMGVGVRKLTMHNVVTTRRVLKTGFEAGFDVLPTGGNEFANAANDLIRKYPGDDDVYIKINGRKIWPQGENIDMNSQTTHSVNYSIDYVVGQGPVTMDVMDYDSPFSILSNSRSYDDNIGRAALHFLEPGFDGEVILSNRQEGSIYRATVSVDCYPAGACSLPTFIIPGAFPTKQTFSSNEAIVVDFDQITYADRYFVAVGQQDGRGQQIPLETYSGQLVFNSLDPGAYWVSLVDRNGHWIFADVPGEVIRSFPFMVEEPFPTYNPPTNNSSTNNSLANTPNSGAPASPGGNAYAPPTNSSPGGLPNSSGAATLGDRGSVLAAILAASEDAYNAAGAAIVISDQGALDNGFSSQQIDLGYFYAGYTYVISAAGDSQVSRLGMTVSDASGASYESTADPGSEAIQTIEFTPVTDQSYTAIIDMSDCQTAACNWILVVAQAP